jgi:MSHA biogenesis protein MshQ
VGGSSSSGYTEGSAAVRSGRVRLLNAYGSERLDLPMAMRAEFWDGGWQLNAADTCTTTNLAFANVSGPANFSNNTCVRDSGNPGASGMGCAAAGVAARQFREAGVAGFAGDFNLWLQAPLVAGSMNVTATVPTWLRFPWASTTAANPAARATFGVYKSPLIYRRENY